MKKFFNKNLILIAVITFICMAIPYCSHAEGSIISRTLAAIGNAAMGLCAWALYLSAKIFDYAVGMSLNNQILNEGLGIVQVGWKIMRDVANISFIFILLYIGITTILQLNTSMIKSLLAKVIIVALLVNFSLVITQTVIGASNVLANEFYQKMNPPQEETLYVLNGQMKGLSAIFVQGLKLQSLNNTEHTNFASEGEEATLRQILIISVFGCIIMITTAFTLLAGGALFLIRSVGLQILMIASPIAFICYILPNTNSHFNTWRSKLLGYSFFAPAFLFQLYILAKVISQRSFEKVLGTTNAGYANVFLGFGNDPSNDVALIIQFVTLIVLMGSILKTSKWMGDKASQSVNAWTDKQLGKIKSYAKGAPRRAARRVAGPAAATIAESKAMGRLAQIPLVGGAARGVTRGTSAIARANREKISSLQKGYEKYNSKELKNLIPGMKGFGQAAAMAVLAKRGDLKPGGALTSSRIKSAQTLMNRYNISTKDIEGLAWQYAATPEERKEAIRKISKDDIGKIAKGYNKGEFGGYFTPEIFEEMHKNFKSDYLKTIYDQGGKASDDFFKSLANDTRNPNVWRNTRKDISKYLSSIGNNRLASWVESSPAAKYFEGYK